MEMLNDELVLDILLRLPLKSLARLKCTSRKWRKTISHPRFTKLHLEKVCSQKILRTNPLQSVDYQAFEDSADDTAVSDLDDPVQTVHGKQPEILGSCDGLVCLLVDEQVVVWNPTTKIRRELPTPRSFPYGKFFYGFGYDSVFDQYKVIRGAYYADDRGRAKRTLEVFPLSGDTWREIRKKEIPDGLSGAGAFCNGAVHWLVRRDRGGEDLDDVIALFDLTEEKFDEELIPVPDISGFEGLRVLRGCLIVYCGHFDAKFEAWTMSEYRVKSSWTRLFSVSTDALPAHKFWFNVVTVTEKGNIVVEVDAWDMIIYDPSTGNYTSFPIKNTYDWLEAVVYTESLVSPYGRRAVTKRKRLRQEGVS